MPTHIRINPDGNDIRGRRGRLGLSQEALARLADCSLPSVSQYERGLTAAASTVLPKLLDALDAAERRTTP
jgi:transcriptional regulator with XRE-family HTH domain